MKELLVAIVVLSTVCADLLQSAEMKRVGELENLHLSGIQALLRTMARKKFLILAVFFMALSFFRLPQTPNNRRAQLRRPRLRADDRPRHNPRPPAPKERVDWRRWAGAALVAGGVYLVS